MRYLPDPEQVRRARDEAGLSIEEASEKLGVEEDFARCLELEVVELDIELCRRIIEVYGTLCFRVAGESE